MRRPAILSTLIEGEFRRQLFIVSTINIYSDLSNDPCIIPQQGKMDLQEKTRYQLNYRIEHYFYQLHSKNHFGQY